jgi:hypothetical protein
MVFSNFPHGFNNGLVVRHNQIASDHPRKVYYVGNNSTLYTGEKEASDNNRGGFNDPFSTIAGANTVVKSGDVVYVRPGFTVAVSTADLDLDQDGVMYLGMGTGTRRPTVTYTGTTDTTTVDISANDVVVRNFLFSSASNDAVDALVTLNGTDCEIGFCEFRADGTAQPDVFLVIGKADNDADRSIVHNCKFTSLTAGANSAISFAKDHDGVIITQNRIDGDWADAGISIPTAGDACTTLLVKDNYVRNRQTGDHAIEIAAVTSARFENNTLVADTLTAIISPVANAVYVNNKATLGANASTTGPGGGEFLVPAHFYHDQVLVTRQQTGSMAAGYATTDDPIEFTVTGAIMVVRAFGVTTTAVTSTGGTGTISLGVPDDEDLLCALVTANGTNFAVGDIWGVTTTTVNGDRTIGSGAPAIIGAGVSIKTFVTTNNITAGAFDLYLHWTPLESTSNVVAAG